MIIVDHENVIKNKSKYYVDNGSLKYLEVK